MNFNLKKIVDNYQKNVLYEIDKSRVVIFTEMQENSTEIVKLIYDLKENEYGIFAHEYRSQYVSRDGFKTADVFTGIVAKDEKMISTLIFDVKRDISAFSDDLLKENAIITGIKEVRDFIKQLHDEKICMNSLLVFLEDYNLIEKYGIVTSSFECEKFDQVADKYEEIFKTQPIKNELLLHKLRVRLKPYEKEVEHLRRFAKKQVLISGKLYNLHVFILEKENENKFNVTIDLKKCEVV